MSTQPQVLTLACMDNLTVADKALHSLLERLQYSASQTALRVSDNSPGRADQENASLEVAATTLHEPV